MKVWRTVWLALLLLAAPLTVTAGEEERDPYTAGPLAPVTFVTAAGEVQMWVEVADTDELRFCGLMHRLSLPDNQGMLFAMWGDSTGGFYNRNTFVPLSIAWLAADGTIVDITDLPNVSPEDNPQVLTYTSPAASYRYVIEANQGWYARNGVAIGDRADLTAALATGSQGAASICRERGL